MYPKANQSGVNFCGCAPSCILITHLSAHHRDGSNLEKETSNLACNHPFHQPALYPISFFPPSSSATTCGGLNIAVWQDAHTMASCVLWKLMHYRSLHALCRRRDTHLQHPHGQVMLVVLTTTLPLKAQLHNS